MWNLVIASLVLVTIKSENNILTTNQGYPIDDNQSSLTIGQYGPTLMQDFQMVEKLAHFNRERIPERVVHAKGTGAHGYFEVTNDITKFTMAKLFTSVGKRTPVFTRFSTVGQSAGSSDTVRDPRGFAVKFYTEEGNWDLVGTNLPVFFLRNPAKFPDLVHAVKQNPRSGLNDMNTLWDFLSQTPESINMITYLFGDLALPDGFAHMNGFGVHAYRLVKSDGDWSYVKFHWLTDQGIRNLTNGEAAKLAGANKDRDRNDLFQSIELGRFPSWKLNIQLMTPDQAKSYGPDAVDPTKIWPTTQFPLLEVGKLVLNKNPENYFAETEQVAFNPANIVPGIYFSEDRLLQGRLLSYGDTQRHRLGTNFHMIPINKPNVTVENNQRDGYMVVNGNFGSQPNYEPNSFGGPKQRGGNNFPKLTFSQGELGRFSAQANTNDYEQAGDLYRNMDSSQKQRLIKTLAGALSGIKPEILERQLAILKMADINYGTRVEQALKNN